MSFLDTLASPVAFVLREIHTGLSHVFPAASGWAWGLSIVLLTISVRLVLFPLFVKQIKSQRRMQELAPKIKELQTKHKGDRETMNTELMKLYKDHGANPISGCLPLILQMPVFFALFRVMNEFKPKNGEFIGKFGLSKELIEQGAHAKVFGAPISAAFNSKPDLLQFLNGNGTTVKIVAAIMIVTMGSTTFFTQKQMMARNGGPADKQQAQIQKIMLYVLPLSFAVFGFQFPIGVLLYWLTTNIWSMGQQAYVIKRMPPVVVGAVATGKGVSVVKAGKGASLVKPAKSGSTVKTTKQSAESPRSTAARANGAKSVVAKSGALSPDGSDVLSSDKMSSDNRSSDNRDSDTRDSDEDSPTSVAQRGAAVPALSRAPVPGSSEKRAAGSRKNKSRKGGRR